MSGAGAYAGVLGTPTPQELLSWSVWATATRGAVSFSHAALLLKPFDVGPLSCVVGAARGGVVGAFAMLSRV